MKNACDNPKCEFHAMGLSDEQVCFVTLDRVVHHRHRHSNGKYYCDVCRYSTDFHPPMPDLPLHISGSAAFNEHGKIGEIIETIPA